MDCSHRQIRDWSATEVLSNNTTNLRGGPEDRYIREYGLWANRVDVISVPGNQISGEKYPYLRRLDRRPRQWHVTQNTIPQKNRKESESSTESIEQEGNIAKKE